MHSALTAGDNSTHRSLPMPACDSFLEVHRLSGDLPALPTSLPNLVAKPCGARGETLARDNRTDVNAAGTAKSSMTRHIDTNLSLASSRTTSIRAAARP